jgi:hypothetical protein
MKEMKLADIAAPVLAWIEETTVLLRVPTRALAEFANEQPAGKVVA